MQNMMTCFIKKIVAGDTRCFVYEQQIDVDEFSIIQVNLLYNGNLDIFKAHMQ
jgi:hypothetical protein